MNSELSCKITLWVNRLIALTVTVLCFAMYSLLVWYRGIREMPWQICAVILVTYYVCVPAVLYGLWCVEKLLRNILAEAVFVPINVRYIRRIRWCCAGVSLLCIPAACAYPPLIFMVVIMGFLAMMVSVVKNVMAAAVELQTENDLTV